MKVLHVLDRSLPNIIGYSLRSKYILELQKRLNIEVVAITSPNQESSSSQEEEEIEGITYYRTKIPNFLPAKLIKTNPLLKSIVFIWCIRRRIKEVVKKENVDIIHAHSPILCGLPALAIGKKYKIPVVYEVRALWEDAAVDLRKTKNNSLRYILTRHYETKLLKEVAAVTVICEGLKKEMLSRGIAESKIHIVSNAIDVEKFLPQPKDSALQQKYNLNGNVVFGFIGSFFEFEGLKYFLRAVSKVISAHKGIRALIVGGGRREEELRLLASKLSKNIIFTGKVPHSVIHRFYSIMDILVYPRVKNRITDLVTPLKPLEAMAMEKTVLASNVGGLNELIDDGKTGLLFKADSIDDLTKKMIYLAKDSRRRKELGKNARISVIKNRNWAEVSKKYLAIYSNLLNNEKVQL